VRIRGGLILLAVCLSLTGCSLFGKKSSTPAPQRPADPPPPSIPPAREPSGPDNFSTTSQSNGVLIGQVLDRYNRRPANVWIRVVDLEDTREPKAAPIEKQSDEQGYFSIPGLRSGGHYQLFARAQDGDRVFSGSLVATPPNPRLTIWVSEEAPGAGNAPAPEQPAYPGKPDGTRRPAAALEPPTKDAPPGATQGPADQRPAQPPPATGKTPDSAVAPAATGSPDMSRTADGFTRMAEPAPKVSVPGPSPALPPGYPLPKDAQPADPPRRPPPPGSPTSQAPAETTPVPSCQLVGRRLINLALYDQNGSVWEYRKSRGGQGRPGRLVLIDFWHSRCGPCLAAMHHIVELNQQYGPYGLDVIGIAYETGTLEQQLAQVRSIRGRYGIRYPTLLSGGPNCPVRSQFDVQAFPTLILIDENGDIVLRKEGLSQRDYEELKLEIYKRLIQ
jgi:thiol-disulfide isomerase/thioredoxin